MHDRDNEQHDPTLLDHPNPSSRWEAAMAGDDPDYLAIIDEAVSLDDDQADELLEFAPADEWPAA